MAVVVNKLLAFTIFAFKQFNRSTVCSTLASFCHDDELIAADASVLLGCIRHSRPRHSAAALSIVLWLPRMCFGAVFVIRRRSNALRPLRSIQVSFNTGHVCSSSRVGPRTDPVSAVHG